MRQILKRTFVRNDNKELLLYGYKEHKESASQELDVSEIINSSIKWEKKINESNT